PSAHTPPRPTGTSSRNPSSTTSSAPPAAPATPGQEPGSSSPAGTPGRTETGDLSAPAEVAAEDALAGPATVTGTPAERSRRRAGGVIIGGFAAVGALGAGLGLRERAVLRHGGDRPSSS